MKYFLYSDINECSGSNDCHPTLATCSNSPGGYSCSCKTGYSGDGRTCTGSYFFFCIFETKEKFVFFLNLLKHLNFERVWVYYESESSTLEKSQIFRILQCFMLTLTWNAQIGLKKVLTPYNNITKITKTGVIKVIWN